MTDQLKPCPFCGTSAHFFTVDDETSKEWGGQGISCKTEMCASVGLMWACGDDPKPALIELWNRRAALATAPEQAGEPLKWPDVYDELIAAGVGDITARRLAAKFTAPPPASTNRLTDAEILEMWSGDPTHSRPVLGKTKILAFARAIIAATEGK